MQLQRAELVMDRIEAAAIGQESAHTGLGDLVHTLRLLWRGRANLIALWSEKDFERRIFAHQFLNRRITVVNDPAGVKHVMSTNFDNYRKSVYTERALKPLVGQGLFISEGELWRRQRRIAMPAFHRTRLRGFAEGMTQAAEEMLQRWERHKDGAELEVGGEMAAVTAEVVCRAMFSGDLGRERAAGVFEAFERYQRTLGRLDIVEMTGLPRWIPRLGARRARKAVRQLDALINGIIATRRREGVERNDLLDLFMNARDPDTGEAMSPSLLRDEVAVSFLAGHETTANALTWAFYLLSQHPEAENRVREEVDRVLGGRRPEYDDLTELPYVRAVIDEGLRLYPPVHIFSREALGDDRIGKRYVPAGSMVVISPWLIHRHRELWSEPDTFRPERFLGEEVKQHDRFAYLPFGAGPRLCIGKGFGLTEATIILAMVAQRFRLRLRTGHVVEPLGRLTLRPRGGMPMTLHRRDATPRSGVEAAEFEESDPVN